MTARLDQHDERASTLRDVEKGDPQQLMARMTGNYKRGNERMGKPHPRNR